jgi:polyphenol oxidase
MPDKDQNAAEISNRYADQSSTSATSRRKFLQALGLGSTFMGLNALGGFGFPTSALADCSPGNPGRATPWRRDCRPIRPRRPASTLSSAEITKLRNAYQAMRALDTSDPNDPRGFQRQANIHCWMCSEGGAALAVHGSWKFFAWHRAYLYFHERILGKLIGDMEFRLPYWDWDVASHRRIPGAYTSPNNATNPLWNSTRAMSPTDELPDEDVGDDVMDAALTAGDFSDFGGTALFSGIPEGAPHGNVHIDVGGFSGDMGAFETAGKDPVFYAHHSNVDKMWSDWNKGSSTHTNPTDAAFLNLTWTFFDENKVWRSITAAQVLNHENQLRYIYGPSRFLEILPCLLDWIVIRTDWRVSRTLKLAPAARSSITKVLDSRGRVRMHLTGVSVPLDKSAVYRLYANPEAARNDKGPGSDGYLGTVPVVLNDLKNLHVHKRTRDVVVNISAQKFESLTRTQAPDQLTLVERGARESVRKPIPVKAADVQFSVADIER